MRILHAYKIYRPDVEGGIPQVMTTLTQNSPTDIESSILVARPKGPAREFMLSDVPVRASAALCTAFSMPISPDYIASFVKQAAKADLVVHHAPFPLTDLTISLLKLRTRLVVHWHAEILNRAFLKALVAPAIRETLKRAHSIIVSHPSIVDHSEFLQPYREKCVAIPYGVDCDYWSRLSSDEADRVDRIKIQSPKLIVAIGRLVPYKGFSILLQAMQGIEAKLVIIGEGPMLEKLEEEADALGIANNVHFAGRLSRDLMKLQLHAADMLAMPSISAAEAFGIVQIEAMSAGCPVINTALSTAVPHIARHEREGLTVPVADVAGFRRAILRVLNEPDLRRRLGNAGLTRAREEFGEQRFRQRNYDLYRQLLNR
jgi:glycosyltransferase involved in cell wall biosynthesis